MCVVLWVGSFSVGVEVSPRVRRVYWLCVAAFCVLMVVLIIWDPIAKAAGGGGCETSTTVVDLPCGFTDGEPVGGWDPAGPVVGEPEVTG